MRLEVKVEAAARSTVAGHALWFDRAAAGVALKALFSSAARRLTEPCGKETGWWRPPEVPIRAARRSDRVRAGDTARRRGGTWIGIQEASRAGCMFPGFVLTSLPSISDPETGGASEMEARFALYLLKVRG